MPKNEKLNPENRVLNFIIGFAFLFMSSIFTMIWAEITYGSSDFDAEQVSFLIFVSVISLLVSIWGVLGVLTPEWKQSRIAKLLILSFGLGFGACLLGWNIKDNLETWGKFAIIWGALFPVVNVTFSLVRHMNWLEDQYDRS